MDFLANVTIRPARQIVQAAEAAAGRRRRAERRVNVRAAAAQPRGEVELHALDASHLRRTISGAWRFDGLMDAAALAAALQRTVDRYPLVAGWLEPRAGGKLALRWDAAARGRGAAWFEAVAPGSPPEVDDDVMLYEADCLPTLRRHCLLAIQVTHYPDDDVTLLVATIDHVVADYQAFIDFLSAWCNECSTATNTSNATTAAAGPQGVGSGSSRAKGAAAPPLPVWDRALLVALSEASDGGGSDAGSADGGSTRGRSPTAGSRSGSGSRISVDSGGSSAASRSTVASRSSSGGGSRASKDSSFWGGESAWHCDVLSKRNGMAMLTGGLVGMMACQTRTWLLPRPAIAALKARLGTAMAWEGKGAPTANDVLSAVLAASVAWVTPGKVARRGGLNVHVVVNARGRFGHAAGADYFGSDSLLVPVWCPAALLPAPDAPSPEPSPDLVAHIHSALREALKPAGAVRRRFEWMAAAQGAGVGARVRACEAAALLAGDVCVDNVSNYPVFDLKFGGAAAATANAMRFITCPRLAWVTAAGPNPDREKGGPSGDLRIALPLKRAHWARLAPWWTAMGLTQVKAGGTLDVAIYHPASLRNILSEATRTAIMGL